MSGGGKTVGVYGAFALANGEGSGLELLGRDPLHSTVVMVRKQTSKRKQASTQATQTELSASTKSYSVP